MARPKTDKQSSRLTVSLDEQDYAEVCRLAAAQDVSAAWIIRRAVQSYLGQHLPLTAPAAAAPVARQDS
jgi:hypothetical protein